MARLKDAYNDEIRAALIEKFGYSSRCRRRSW
jgi:hypothetical protein